jgi:hypothetical protein
MEGDDASIKTDAGGLQAVRLTYCVRKVRQPIVIDADYNKPAWQDIEPLLIAFAQPTTGEHRPTTQAKVCYDDTFLYVIFQAADRYVRAVATATHGPVWQDSCVEFFFTPRARRSNDYFNLEMNCIGTFLFRHQSAPRQNSRSLERNDCERIQIAGSLAGPIPDENTEPLTWSVECAVPFEILNRYAEVQRPSAGVVWHGNFYKCADHSSHPHWLTWSPVSVSTPDFHRPESFGVLLFE